VRRRVGGVGGRLQGRERRGLLRSHRRPVYRRLELADPLLDQPHRRRVHLLRADVGHPAPAGLGHAVQQDRAARVAGGDQAGVGDVERAEQRLDVNRLRLRGAGVEAQVDHRRPAAAEAVAVGAVRMEVRAGARLDVARTVVRVGHRAERL
jgi:hypothetical protein